MAFMRISINARTRQASWILMSPKLLSKTSYPVTYGSSVDTKSVRLAWQALSPIKDLTYILVLGTKRHKPLNMPMHLSTNLKSKRNE